MVNHGACVIVASGCCRIMFFDGSGMISCVCRFDHDDGCCCIGTAQHITGPRGASQRHTAQRGAVLRCVVCVVLLSRLVLSCPAWAVQAYHSESHCSGFRSAVQSVQGQPRRATP